MIVEDRRPRELSIAAELPQNKRSHVLGCSLRPLATPASAWSPFVSPGLALLQCIVDAPCINHTALCSMGHWLNGKDSPLGT
jgi:hypothetical protein